MAEFLHVPEVAAGSEEVTLSEWLAAEGDDVAAGSPVAVVETDKATVEIEVDSGATLLRRLAEPGGQLSVGAPLAVLGSSADSSDDVDALLAQAGHGKPEPEPEPEPEAQPDAEPAAAGGGGGGESSGEEPSGGPGAAPSSQPDGAARIFMSPIARRLLREAGIDPSTVPGSGPGGRVVRRDVEAVLAERQERGSTEEQGDDAVVGPADGPDQEAAGAGDVPAGIGTHRAIPHSRVRKAVASRLAQSKQSAPHFYMTKEVVVDELLSLRAQLNEHAAVKLSVNDFLIRAVAVAHREVPAANAVWTDEAVLEVEGVDIGVAIASGRGLVTPCLRDVQTLSLSGISTGVKAFAEQAEAGRLQQRDLEGGTICVSNLGMYGIDDFAAIINPPHSAILAVGAAQQRPVVSNGELQVGTVLRLVLSVDHRVIDGALAATWMAALATAIENPLRLVV